MNTHYHSEHFRKIAPHYQSLRTTDAEPVEYIARHLKSVTDIHAADVGCGTGRYTSLLMQYLQDKTPIIHGIDYSIEMLKQMNIHFSGNGRGKALREVNASYMKLPFKSESLDCLFTFNAIHHFMPEIFFSESARVLKNGGYIFIYTRLRSQNSRNIWGRYFPLFNEKETRLHESGDLERYASKVPGLHWAQSQPFTFPRSSSANSLLRLAKYHHYSTFTLYTPDELDGAMQEFSENLGLSFVDQDNIQWIDENILLVFQKE